MHCENPIIDSRAVEPFFKNGYILACPETREAFYIDPGDEAEQVLAQIEKLDLQLQAIVNTHAHIDHISGNGTVKERWDVPIYLHPDEQIYYERLPLQAQFFGLQYAPAPPVDFPLTPGDALTLGRLSIDVIFTPGHSPGHVTLVVGDHVFCGDTVFAGSIGRTDLAGGSHAMLLASIKEKILPLGDEKVLYPGHGPITTIAREKSGNPFLTVNV